MKPPKLRAFYRANSEEMFIIWTHYDNKPEKHGFVLYRNGVEIAKHVPDDEEPWGPFYRGTRQFRHDHGTNLFRDSNGMNQLVYIDPELPKYQEYEYKVEKIRYNDEGRIVGTVMSNPVYVRTE